MTKDGLDRRVDAVLRRETTDHGDELDWFGNRVFRKLRILCSGKDDLHRAHGECDFDNTVE
jgi:hypothetical protein